MRVKSMCFCLQKDTRICDSQNTFVVMGSVGSQGYGGNTLVIEKQQMSSKSNDRGRAYEYITLLVIEREIRKFRPVKIEQNSSFFAARRAWQTLSVSEKNTYEISASVAATAIFDMEPRMVEDGDDTLELFIQTDEHGEEGDVRDIIVLRRNIQWEIGLSLKHNHFAVKHSRLSYKLDFGKSWYEIPCSEHYWNEVKPIFDYLSDEKKKGTKFSELNDKENDVYIPLLTAFINEVKRQYDSHRDIPQKLIEYLLGKFDSYKVISIEREKLTRIEGFNLHGKLNLNATKQVAKVEVPILSLPKRIVHLAMMPDSTNTVELYLDGGWQFSFRIHNAETYVTPSLKFDIQIVGMPTAILTINCKWN